MKRYIFALIAGAGLLGAGIAPVSAQAQECPAEGTAHTESGQALNVLKNRSSAPQADQIDHAATLAAILAPGDDTARWSDAKGAQIIGYVVHVKPGGVETVNCGAHDLAHRDTHIEVALTPNAPETARMIVEVTPTWREKMAALGFDWTTHHLEDVLRGKRAVIRGWLMFELTACRRERKHGAGQGSRLARNRLGDSPDHRYRASDHGTAKAIRRPLNQQGRPARAAVVPPVAEPGRLPLSGVLRAITHSPRAPLARL